MSTGSQSLVFGRSDSLGRLDAAVADTLARLRAKQTSTPPVEGPAAVPGQRVAFITITQVEWTGFALLKGLQSAAEALGWEQTSFDANGIQSEADRFMQEAVAAGNDAIVVIAVNATATAAGLAAAQAAGIPVGGLACWPEDNPRSLGPYAVIDPLPAVFEQIGYANAAFAYEKTDGNPRFLTFNDLSLSNLSARQVGFDRFIAECEAAGANCSVVATQNFRVAEMTTTLASQAASIANAAPSFNAVWASFDTAAQYITEGLNEAGIPTDSSFLVAANGDPASLQTIKDDGYQKATVALAKQWSSWGMLDNLNRVLAGEPVVDQNVPIRLFDSTNIHEASGWEGDVDFKSYYTRIWNGE